MLVESIIRKTLGLKRHCVKKVTEEHGEIVVYLLPDRRFTVVCSSYGSQGPGYDTFKERRWKHVPLWGIPVTLVYSPRMVECNTCGMRVEDLPWSQGKSQLSLPLSVVLATWSKLVAWKVVGQLFGFHWNTVRKAVKNVVDYGLANRDLGNLLYIGIDEISRKRGHVYHTHVYDLMEKRLLWSGEDRKSETLEAFFDYLGKAIYAKRKKHRRTDFRHHQGCDGIPPVPPPGIEPGFRGVGLGLYCIQPQKDVRPELRVRSKNKEF